MSLTPKNWKVFQHYKDRKPAWIKLHRDLLDDFAYFNLPLASRALAPCLWLLASEFLDGEISASDEEVCFRLHISLTDYREAVKPLIDSGFFISASAPIADCKQTAMPEREGETEKEKRRGERPSGNFERKKESGHREESGIIAATERAIERLSEVQPQVRGGEGPAIVRLLPQGRGQ